MKKISFLLLSACLAVLLASCKEEQTVLDFDQLPYSATLKGKLTYDAGFVEVSPGRYERQTKKPAAGRKVFAKIGYDQYDPAASGSKTYETTTDANGEYAFNVKTTADGVEVSVYAAPFTDVYGDLLVEDGVQKLVQKPYRYTLNTPVAFSGHETLPGTETIRTSPASYSGTALDGKDEFPYLVTVKGVVKKQSDDGSGNTTYIPAGGVSVMAFVEGAPVIVSGKTSADGEYTLQLPLKHLEDDYYILVDALSFEGRYAKYDYATSSTITLAGIYAQRDGASFNFLSNGFNNRTVTMPDIMMYFTENN